MSTLNWRQGVWGVVGFALGWGAMLSAEEPTWKPVEGKLMTRWAKDVSADAPLPEYPRPQWVRSEWKNLNGLWEFDHAQPRQAPPFGRTLSKRILVPFAVESGLSGLAEKASEVWYRRTVVLDDWIRQQQRVRLHFGAVDWEARVWVNGQYLGEHRGGYDGFSFDITAALKPSGEQEIVVGVWDPSDQGYQPCGKQAVKPEGIWYTSVTGIWQTVWLEPLPSAAVEKIRVTPDIDQSRVHLEVEVSGLTGPAVVSAVARDPSRNHAVVGGVRLRVSPQQSTSEGHLVIDQPQLWSPETPFLYDLEVSLETDTGVIDRARSYFGMRKISLGKDAAGVTRLFLNNAELFQFGPLDQGYWPDGLYTAPTDEALRYDIEITKQLGFNMSRKHVKVEPDRWYYWADKLGLLVWQDMPSGDQRVAPGFPDMKRSAQSARQFENELTSIVSQLHNHPCIVHWVVFNEGWGQFETQRLTDWTKSLDPSRLVIGVSGWNDRKTGDIHDIHHYPPPKSPPAEATRAVVNGEYGGLGLPMDGHTWQGKDNWGYQQFKSVEELVAKYADFVDRVHLLRGTPGMSAAVYTQLTDVEIEVNGLLTYDREVIKGDLYQYRDLNTKVFRPPPVVTELIPASIKTGRVWRHTSQTPSEDWMKEEFDATSWKEGEAGFGRPGLKGATIRTNWLTQDLWLRTEFEIPELPADAKLLLSVFHDDEAEIYINGQILARLDKWSTDYVPVAIDDKGRSLFRTGKNTIAVHVHQDKGDQFFDLGLLQRIDPK
jgi:hypothetical protein